VAINVKQLVGQVLSMFLVFALALLLPAGSIGWVAGWVYLFMFFGFVIAISVWLFKNNPGLLEERMTGRAKPNQQAWDRPLIALAGGCFLSWFVLVSLDAQRFRWSQMPVWLQLAGAAILMCSFYVFFLTFRENSYLSPAIRVQEERGQTVVSTGPYHYVRHPMYAGFILFVTGTTLLLGSWYGFILGMVLVGIMAVRAVLEERTLRKELQGYDVYMTQVRYRLIPGVW
jgi:protein-S-isoprenylcysteine O-methyltransferase Ste14